MSRQKSREQAFKFLYQLEIQKGNEVEQKTIFLREIGINDGDLDYFNLLVDGVCAQKEDLDKNIEPYLKNWTLQRLPRVDLTILRIAVYEIFYEKDIPLNVAIAEAVRLAFDYTTDESKAFINGILGKIGRLRTVSPEESNLDNLLEVESVIPEKEI